MLPHELCDYKGIRQSHGQSGVEASRPIVLAAIVEHNNEIVNLQLQLHEIHARAEEQDAITARHLEGLCSFTPRIINMS